MAGSIAGLNTLAWTILAYVQARTSIFKDIWGRGLAMLGLAVAVGSFIVLAFPDFLSNPLTGVDSQLNQIWLDDNTELRPLLSANRFDIGPTLIFLGIGLLAVPRLVFKLTRVRDSELWPGQCQADAAQPAPKPATERCD